MALLSIKKRILSAFIKQDKFNYLRKFPILSDFSNHELFLFSQIVHERQFKQGEIIYQENFPLAVIYLIANGSIEVKEDYQNQENAVILNKHQFIGIIDMYNETKRKGEARAYKDSQLLAISHLDFQTFIKTNPRTGVKLLNNICMALSHYILHTYLNSE